MKIIIKWLFRHIHCYNMPIASQYNTFSSRNIVFECKCGKRKIEQVWRRFGDAFPIETTSFITNSEMQKIKENERKENNYSAEGI